MYVLRLIVMIILMRVIVLAMKDSLMPGKCSLARFSRREKVYVNLI